MYAINFVKLTQYKLFRKVSTRTLCFAQQKPFSTSANKGFFLVFHFCNRKKFITIPRTFSYDMESHILSTRYGVDEENIVTLREDAMDFALVKGLSMRVPDLTKDSRVPIPFCLVPSVFPKSLYQNVVDLQPYINSVLLQVSNSKEFILECLSSSIESDEFTRNIFKIYEAVEPDDQLALGLIRTDYLLNSDPNGIITGIKQVENNTIASSYGGLAPVVRELHEFVLKRLGQKRFDDKLPTNQSAFTLAQGIVTAWDYYGNINTGPSAIILFVVEDYTTNINDQRAFEHAILDLDSQLEIMRCTLKELRTCAVLKGKTLFVKGKEVAIVYYRTGYVPKHYEPEDWEVRLLMERSRAIKCPSAGLHLAGTKKVQLHLTKPGVLEQFVKKEKAAQLRKVFVELYSLEMGQSGDSALAKGIENPERYVLKPEREGGGNNLYDAELKEHLQKIKSSAERNSYILMERINAPLIPNCIVRADSRPEIINVIGELGIFGTILGNREDIFVNNVAGYLLRSKPANTNECGVTLGYGALDSLYVE